jgi:hypothetical protein
MVDVGWTTTEQARAGWPDAPKSDERLNALLLAAYESGVIYAPAIPDGAAVPQRYKEAQLLTARAIWTAARAQADALGLNDDGVNLATVTPTLSGQIQQLYRPPGPPVVG